MFRVLFFCVVPQLSLSHTPQVVLNGGDISEGGSGYQLLHAERSSSPTQGGDAAGDAAGAPASAPPERAAEPHGHGRAVAAGDPCRRQGREQVRTRSVVATEPTEGREAKVTLVFGIA